jgi:hypothetical protein
VDGELESRTESTATAFGRPRGDGLDMRRRLPGLLGRFGGNGCGHCQPLSARISTSPSAEADVGSQPIRQRQGKGKGGEDA